MAALEKGSDSPKEADEDLDLFTYSELSPGIEKAFRLLYLAAGTEGGDIECLLVEADLAQSANTFEALSYVWGDASAGRKTIKVNGTPFNVGANLYNALLHLRPKDEYRILWADAICINQDDIPERVRQVGLMRDIYKTAKQTVAWLGEPGEKTDKMFEGIQVLGDEALEMQAAGQTPVSEKGPAYKHIILKLDGASLFYDTILTNDWWKRVWILQEIVLAQKATLYVGHQKVDWNFLVTAMAHATALDIFSNSFFGTAMTPWTQPLDVVVSMKNTQAVTNPGAEFLSYAFLSHGRAATDPRDKLFGILGLMTADSVIQVDYTAAPSDVFIRSTRALIEASGNLDALGFCYPYKPNTYSDKTPLPSWVPQWDSTGTFARPMMFLADPGNTLRTTHASRGHLCKPTWADNGQTLVAEGFIVDTVKRLSSVLPSLYLNNIHEGSMDYMDRLEEEAFKNSDDPNWDPSFWGYMRELGGWIKYLGKLISGGVSQVLGAITDIARFIEWEDFVQKETGTPGKSTEASNKILCEILSAGTQYPGGQAETMEQFSKWSKSLWYIRKLKAAKVDRVSTGLFQIGGFLLGLKTEVTKKNNAFSQMILHPLQRRMGVTQAGRMALFPRRAEEGDQVVILKGGRAPVILRPRGDGYVEFIGEAYVCGIMDGEAVRPNVQWSNFLIS